MVTLASAFFAYPYSRVLALLSEYMSESERKVDIALPRYAERLEDPGLLCSRQELRFSPFSVPKTSLGVLVPLLSSICWVIVVGPTQQGGATISPLGSLTPLI